MTKSDHSMPHAEIDGFSPPRRDGSIYYISPEKLYQTEKPYFMNVPVQDMPGLQQTNVKHTGRVVPVTDIRGHEDLFSLDKTGFQIVHHHTNMNYPDFENPDAIVGEFYNEVCDVIRSATGAVEVLPFDYQIRRRDPTLPLNSRGAPGKAQPFGAVHAGL